MLLIWYNTQVISVLYHFCFGERCRVKNIFKRAVWFLFLHCLLLVYSLSDIVSKLASYKEFLSLEFLILYGIVIVLLGIYAIFWQQVLKKIPLITAYANKSVTIIWGMVFGTLIFKEQISWNQIMGAIVIIMGVYLVVLEDAKE